MRTFPIFAVLFFIVPIIEIYLLIQVGQVVGALATIFLVVLTAVIGAILLRQQGLSTLMRFQQVAAQGKVPTIELLEGLVLLIGGVLLMTPGFFTDFFGFACLLPISRRFIVYFLLKNSQIRMNQHDKQTTQARQTTYEGEFIRKEDD